MNWIKTAWEAFKSDMKTRLGIALALSILLIFRSYIEQLPRGKNIFSIIAVPSFFICIIFWVSIFLDLLSKLVQNLEYQYQNYKYRKYILSLRGRKLDIIKKIYNHPQHHCYLSQKDTDVIELTMHHVIICPDNKTILSRAVWTDDFNDPPFLFVLQPEALKIMEKHKRKFTSNRSAK